MKFLFRTNASPVQGIGHLVRCVNLANELLRSGHDCLFVVDFLDNRFLGFLQEIPAIGLYDSNMEQILASDDADKMLQICNQFTPDWVLLDDYRIGQEWENSIVDEGIKLGVIDDLGRHHKCNLVVDCRYRGINTNSYYDELVSIETMKLLGPKYVLLDAKYSQTKPVVKNEMFTLMLSLGGGGDMRVCQRIIEQLLPLAKARQMLIRVVVGPTCSGAEEFLHFCHTFDCVEPIVGKTDLYHYFIDTDFYIGAAGGTLYQLLALGIPALTFTISENQFNHHADLEAIGHFYHLNHFNDDDLSHLSDFMLGVMQHFKRVRSMKFYASSQIDGQGVKRTKAFLLGEQPEDNFDNASKIDDFPVTKLTDVYSLRPVNDADVNHYLDSRNLAENAKNMLQTSQINRLSHYAWWLSAQRESFLLSKHDEKCLYIWHQIKQLSHAKVLIGGWFVCKSEVSFQDALLALNWQLKHCDQYMPGIPWVAVIHRENKFVKLLNQYLGFEEIASNHSLYSSVEEAFPNADPDKFFYVIRKGNLESKHESKGV